MAGGQGLRKKAARSCRHSAILAGNFGRPGIPSHPSLQDLGASQFCPYRNDQECPGCWVFSGCSQTHSAWVSAPLHTWSAVCRQEGRPGNPPLGAPPTWAGKTKKSKRRGLMGGWAANDIGWVAPWWGGARKSQMPMEAMGTKPFSFLFPLSYSKL